MYLSHVIIKHVKYLFIDANFIILAPELMLMFNCNFITQMRETISRVTSLITGA